MKDRDVPGVVRDIQAEIDQFQKGLNDIRPTAVDFFKSLRGSGLEVSEAAMLTACYIPGPVVPWRDDFGQDSD